MKKILTIKSRPKEKPIIRLNNDEMSPDDLFERIKELLFKKGLVTHLGEDAIPEHMRYDISGDFTLYDTEIHFYVVPTHIGAIGDIIEQVETTTKTHVWAYETEHDLDAFYTIIVSTQPRKRPKKKNIKSKITGFFLVVASLLVLIFLVYILKFVYTLED